MADVRPSETLPILARLDRPRASDRVRLAVIADPHVSPRATGGTKVYHQSSDRLKTALHDADARGVDAITLLGDLTKDGTAWEFDHVDTLLESISTPWYAIPGNHDVQKEHDDHSVLPLERFIERYTPGQLPYRVNLGPIQLLALNSASTPSGDLSDVAGGMVTREERAWLDDELERSDNPIVLVHHNTRAIVEKLAATAPDDGPSTDTILADEWRFFLQDPAPVADILVAHEVPLVLTGHLHFPDIGEHRGFREVTAPATGSYPQSYLLVTISPQGTTVRVVPVGDPATNREAYRSRKSGDILGPWFSTLAATNLASLPLLVD